MAVASQATGVTDLDAALSAIVDRTAQLADADLVVARLSDENGGLVAHAVHARSEAVRAELEGSRIDAAGAPTGERTAIEQLPAPLRLAAGRVAAVGVLQLPVRDRGALVGSLELMRSRNDFDDLQRTYARAAADEVALARRAFAGGDSGGLPDPLELAGDALAAGAAETRAADQVAALAAEATGAGACLVWHYEDDGEHVLAALAGPEATAAPSMALDSVRRAKASREPLIVEGIGDGHARGPVLVTLRLGEPPLGALQLLFSQPLDEDGPLLAGLGTFAVRVAHALRANEHRRVLAADLDHTRALLTIVGQAIAELSLAHTLDTAVERVRELLVADRLAVYLLDEAERLETAAERELTGPHLRVGERLLELTFGSAHGSGLVLVPDAPGDLRLAPVRDALEEVGIEAALGVLLRAGEQVVGLLAVYPARGRVLTESEDSLLRALAAQLAVAVQNAQLHERVERESGEAKRARDEQAAVSRRLRALYEISRSFTEGLVDGAFEVVVKTIVEELGVDAAVLRIPHERGDSLVPAAVHVREERLAEPVRRILSLPQPLSPDRPTAFRTGEALVLDPQTAGALGPAHQPLIPFLDQGSTAAVIPLIAHERILGTLTLLSLDVDRPIGDETLEAAVSIAGPTALALDNARLQQQRKEFTETMQRSLLPRRRPELPGLEVGAVYAPSTRVEVGGDVYDFMELGDGRLAVVLGDVMGHGIDAAADMAMAKFVFRSLAREHPEPHDFLAAANEVVLGEIGATKFITLLYLTVDPRSGELACACAGHPSPRVVGPGAPPAPVPVTGLALGIESDQSYESVRVRLEPGASAVLYTDGLLEARREGELFGQDRLDAALVAHAELPAEELARALVEDCHAFAGELGDDLAVVVIKRVLADDPGKLGG
jgi:serine phosphatase RsbU (regulator of sigma subunit)